MVMESRMTAEQFADSKYDLPEAGRWYELHEGLPVSMEAPDDDHGNAVLNLTRALADWFQSFPREEVGYACHEVGLCVATEPDTVYCPAVSYFRSGQQFEESERAVAGQVPELVIDVASSNDRRREMRRRTLAYVSLGVKSIWVPDPMKREVQIITPGSHTLALGGQQLVESPDVLAGFQMKVSDVFVQPSWWR